MPIGKNIYYNNNQISCFDELLEILFSTNLYKTDNLYAKIAISQRLSSVLNELYKYEFIVFHNRTPKNAVLIAPYSFDDMIMVQDSLNLLNTLESIKYMDNIINARSLLHKYLYSQYDISSCNIIAQNSDVFINTKIINRSTLSTNTKYQYGNNILTLLNEINNTSPSKSIRNHLTKFINEKFSTSTSSIATYNLFIGDHSRKTIVSDNSSDFDLAKTRLFLPAHQALPFLLSFVYYDGRDFSNNAFQKNKDNLPLFKQENSASEFSYKLVLKQIHKLFANSTDNHDILMINSMTLCDQTFLYKKLNLLYSYYKKYTNESFLDALIHYYNFTYKELSMVKDVLIESIFNDDEFISKGLYSNYLDFMLLFNIFFVYLLISTPSFDLRGLQHLECLITKCKDKTKTLLSQTPPSLSSTKNIIVKNGTFKLYETEQKIKDSLIKNPFYKEYYLTSDYFIDEYLEPQNQYFKFPINFSVFKTAFRI